jgi:hypothetical protein
MIPVYVLSEPTLAISAGHRPADSRPAVPAREYEPGSGESHDPAPVHRPHPPRSPPPWAAPGGQANDRRAKRAGPGPAPTQLPARHGLRPLPALTGTNGQGIRPPRPAGRRRNAHQTTKPNKHPLGREQDLTGPFHRSDTAWPTACSAAVGIVYGAEALNNRTPSPRSARLATFGVGVRVPRRSEPSANLGTQG